MALCRFSDYQCDLYIYESNMGIECHVAARRHEGEPEPPLFPLEDGADWDAFWRDYEVYSAKLEACQLINIGLSSDGESRTFGDWGEVLAYVTELKVIGYQVPDWVIEDVKTEMDDGASPPLEAPAP